MNKFLDKEAKIRKNGLNTPALKNISYSKHPTKPVSRSVFYNIKTEITYIYMMILLKNG